MAKNKKVEIDPTEGTTSTGTAPAATVEVTSEPAPANPERELLEKLGAATRDLLAAVAGHTPSSHPAVQMARAILAETERVLADSESGR